MVSFDPVPSRRFLTGHLLWFGSWLVVTVIGLRLHPSPLHHGTHHQLGLPPCPSMLLWNRPCPGCGLTTSFTATLHGDLHAAWVAHPFGSFLYAAWTVTALACLYGFVRRLRFDTDSRQMSFALAGLALAFFAFGVWRFAALPHWDPAGIANAAGLPKGK